MAFELVPLPYKADALAPHMSEETVAIHHDRHQESYVSTLNELIEGTLFDGSTLETIMRATAHDPRNASVFNNAAQIWNHEFFWLCMTPDDGEPSESFREAVNEGFGDFDSFKAAFVEAAGDQFGSGWAWLILRSGDLKIVTTSNAGNPVADGDTPLLTCDVWEHAYYLDHQNERQSFVQTFLDKLVDWGAVSKRYETAITDKKPAAA